jgi:hypothetical protein
VQRPFIDIAFGSEQAWQLFLDEHFEQSSLQASQVILSGCWK